MPKAPMTQEEVEQIRGRILDTALEIIIDEGFGNLSVRKIASRLGITATTIYNYYKNKDELNLMIRMRGFEKLHDILTLRSEKLEDPKGRLKAMIKAYVEFGRKYPSYYDIMFNLHTPKYLDYVGTDIEPVAFREKENALKCLALYIEPVNAWLPGLGEAKDRFVLHQIVRIWPELHGVVTLYNSRLFHEVMDDVDTFIETRTDELIERVMDMKKRIDVGELNY